ncbi:MAG: nitroreductase [Pseudomonadota bacterium]
MPDPNTAALAFLQTRRSRPAKTLGLPVPDREELAALLTIAARTPDHGKLEPWRFIVVDKAGMAKLSEQVYARAIEIGKDDQQAKSACGQFDMGNLAVVVVEVQKEGLIPEIEQSYSAGCVCLSLLNAALASGWGANWLSGWPSHDRKLMRQAIGLADNERVAGIIHIGTETSAPPERPRPDVEALTTWL